MEMGIWPGQNPKADALLGAYLDRALRGWRLRIRWDEVSADEVVETLWPLPATLKTETTVAPLAEELADAHLEKIAEGAPMVFDDLEPVVKAVLQARVLVALAGATAATLTQGPVMRLPHGLSVEQRQRAIVLRSLYQAALSIEGLQ